MVCDACTRILLGEKLTQDDLTDLALLRLDLMSIIQVDRPMVCREWFIRRILVPYEVPISNGSNGNDARVDAQNYEFLEPEIPAHLDTDFTELIESLEDEMARVRQTARKNSGPRPRSS